MYYLLLKIIIEMIRLNEIDTDYQFSISNSL